jgi:hypothetical protein
MSTLIDLTPGDINPVWFVVVALVALGLTVWVQRALSRAIDRRWPAPSDTRAPRHR